MRGCYCSYYDNSLWGLGALMQSTDVSIAQAFIDKFSQDLHGFALYISFFSVTPLQIPRCYATSCILY